jgi:hypothetical protein
LIPSTNQPCYLRNLSPLLYHCKFKTIPKVSLWSWAQNVSFLPTKACYYWHFPHWYRPLNIIVHYCRTDNLLLGEKISTCAVLSQDARRDFLFEMSQKWCKWQYICITLDIDSFNIYGICLRYYITVNSKQSQKYHSGVEHRMILWARFHYFECHYEDDLANGNILVWCSCQKQIYKNLVKIVANARNFDSEIVSIYTHSNLDSE